MRFKRIVETSNDGDIIFSLKIDNHQSRPPIRNQTMVVLSFFSLLSKVHSNRIDEVLFPHFLSESEELSSYDRRWEVVVC